MCVPMPQPMEFYELDFPPNYGGRLPWLLKHGQTIQEALYSKELARAVARVPLVDASKDFWLQLQVRSLAHRSLGAC